MKKLFLKYLNFFLPLRKKSFFLDAGCTTSLSFMPELLDFSSADLLSFDEVERDEDGDGDALNVISLDSGRDWLSD